MPSADSNYFDNYIFEESDNVEHTNYSLVVGMYYSIFVYISRSFIKIFVLCIYIY